MVFYDQKPSKTAPVGDGRYRYRWGIEEVAAPSKSSTDEENNEETFTQWKANEVIVPILNSNVITAAVIAYTWDSSYEQKLVNDYNSAKLGLYGDEESQAKIDAYTKFLDARNALKSQVDADCAELGIK